MELTKTIDNYQSAKIKRNDKNILNKLYIQNI